MLQLEELELAIGPAKLTEKSVKFAAHSLSKLEKLRFLSLGFFKCQLNE